MTAETAPAPASEPTVNEIRRVALEMFSARGYDGTSIRDIATAVGIRGSSMYNHFASKEAILWDLTSRAFDQLHETWVAAAQRLPAEAPPLMQLEAFVHSDIRFHAIYRREASLINAHIPSLNAEHRAAAIARRAAYEEILTGIVQAYVGPARAEDPRTRLTVYAILQMCMAVSGWFRPDGPLSIDEVAAAYAEMARKLVV